MASGLRDTIGLYQHASEAERACCKAWLAAFDASHLADRNYMTYYIERAKMLLRLGEKKAARTDLDKAIKLGVPHGMVQPLLLQAK